MKTLLTILFLAASGLALDVSIPTARYRANVDILVPVNVDDADSIAAYQFDLHYDPSVIRPVGDNAGCTVEETYADLMSVICNESTPGTLNVAAFGVEPIDANGEGGPVLYVKFHAYQGKTTLTFANAYFFELIGIIPATYSDGFVILGRTKAILRTKS